MDYRRLKEQAGALVEGAKYQAENLYRSATDSVEDVIDFTSATFLKAYAGMIGTYYALKYAGIAVALVTAPVPTLVALAVLWMMELSIDSIKSDIDNELKDGKKKRDFDRVVNTLKKYGKIPQNALVETKFVKMEIDSLRGSVNGVVLAGKFKGVSLNDINDDELLELAAKSPDADTKSLLESYRSYREKAKCITAQP